MARAPVTAISDRLLHQLRTENVRDMCLGVNVDVEVVVLMDNFDGEWESRGTFQNIRWY